MTPPSKLLLGLLLTACAGFIDAIGFIELGGFYTSFMSGNTTQLGAGLHEGAAAILLPLSLIAMFFAGSFGGSLLAISNTRWATAMTLGLVVVALGTSVWLSLNGFSSAQAMVVLALGAGAQNAALRSNGSARLGTTFVTGTLFTAGHDLALALRRMAPPWRWLQHLLVWSALFIGAAIGAFVYSRMGTVSLTLPMAVYVFLFLAATARAALRRSPQ